MCEPLFAFNSLMPKLVLLKAVLIVYMTEINVKDDLIVPFADHDRKYQLVLALDRADLS